MNKRQTHGLFFFSCAALSLFFPVYQHRVSSWRGNGSLAGQAITVQNTLQFFFNSPLRTHMPPPPVWRSVTKQGIPDFSDIQRSAAEIQRLLIKGILYRVRIRYTLPVPGSETLVNFVPLMRQSPSPYHRLPLPRC